jgi:hypothetical protein
VHLVGFTIEIRQKELHRMPAIECAKLQCDIMPAFFSINVTETEVLLSNVIWLVIFQYFKIPYGTVYLHAYSHL